MSGINLEKSLEKLKKCYLGKINGVHTLGKSRITDLEFKVAMYRVNLAFANKEITVKEFYKKIKR